MLSRTAQNSEQFDLYANTILLVNVAGMLILLVLLVGNLVRLLREYRSHVPGSKLKARMVGMFVGLAIVPLLVVFYFSMQFINRGIDTWFNVQVEEGLDDALELSRRGTRHADAQPPEHDRACRQSLARDQRRATRFRRQFAARRGERGRDHGIRPQQPDPRDEHRQ